MELIIEGFGCEDYGEEVRVWGCDFGCEAYDSWVMSSEFNVFGFRVQGSGPKVRRFWGQGSLRIRFFPSAFILLLTASRLSC